MLGIIIFYSQRLDVSIIDNVHFTVFFA